MTPAAITYYFRPSLTKANLRDFDGDIYQAACPPCCQLNSFIGKTTTTKNYYERPHPIFHGEKLM